jgi:hypothetical protein
LSGTVIQVFIITDVSCRAPRRIKLDGFHVFHVERNLAAASARARTDKHCELLIVKAYDLAANHAAILQANSVCQGNHAQAQGKDESDH